jgi:hypothetical protein
MKHSMRFDGFGINATDEYATRVATFTMGHRDPELGYKMAAAQELYDSVKALLACADPQRDRVEIKEAREALALAEFGTRAGGRKTVDKPIKY